MILKNKLYSLLGIAFLVVSLTTKAAYFEPAREKFHSLIVSQISDKDLNKELQTHLNKIGKELANSISHKHLTLISLRVCDDLLDYTKANLKDYVDTTLSQCYDYRASKENPSNNPCRDILKLPFTGHLLQFRHYLVAQFDLTDSLRALRDVLKTFIRKLYKELKQYEEDRDNGEGKWLVFYDDNGKVRAEMRLDFIPHLTFATVPKTDSVQIKDFSKYNGLKLPPYTITKSFEVSSKEITNSEVLAKLLNKFSKSSTKFGSSRP